MKEIARNKPKLKHLSFCVMTALAAQTALIQQANAEEAVKVKDVERISVIGSHIKVNHDTGALPVTAISAEDIENSGAISGAELLADIPQQGDVAFNSSRAVGGVNDARGDVSSYNLRGLGTGNTLVLLNGRRLVLHPGTQSENFVPVTTANANTLPVRGLKRVEILRDGAAAIYGSDAVAGVVNYALKDNYEGAELNLNYGTEEGTERDILNLSGATGFFLNEDKTHISMSAGYYKREMIMASEKSYAKSADLRENSRFPDEVIITGTDDEGNPIYGNNDLHNLNSSTPWGEFNTATLGTFHLQPDTLSGCENSDSRGNPTTALDVGGVCVDRGSQPSSDGYDRNSERSLSSGVERANFYGMLTHQVNDEIELYSEALYYYAKADRVREQTANLTSQRFTISENAFYNPFGEEVSLRKYRPVDTGPRNIEVTDTSYRLLTGLRGYFNEWDWDSAVLYSKANTEDKANRIHTQRFQEAINSTNQATAYDVFNGADINNTNIGDPTGNSQSVIDSFMIDVVRESETELALFDFKISKADIFELPAGDVGFAAGVEYRYESFFDVRSDTLNTNEQFLDILGGAKDEDQFASVVLGSSPTPDAAGSRNVFSAYTEFAVPLLEGLPFIERLDMQIAARYERFSDVGDIMKPKAALSWIINDYVQFRASYAEGFKAPGLPQVVAVDISRLNTRSDPVTDSRYGVLEVRSGSDKLKPEESENLSWGFVIQPTKNLTFTADWWQLDQTDTVGLINSQTQLLYDAMLRYQDPTGDGNTLITRGGDDNEVVAIQNDYVNLQDRESSGLDIGITYDLETGLGKFKFKANAAKLMKFTQLADDVTTQIIAAQNSSDQGLVDALKYSGDEITITGSGDLIGQNGRPEWRVTSSLDWRKAAWGAGLRYRYVSGFEDTSLDYSIGEQDFKYQVDSFSKVDTYVNYRLPKSVMEKTKVTLGIKNLTDKKPPIADESFGYNSSVHSSLGRYFYMNINKKF
ncbi:TonB-dependent receptor domain-containing protein [Cognaticolwellia aestuarii]|uniref:TonB-dependent receptor domain-containing protein n=1 Tax=Cognaticolwellia aestuarii TaxID=329993 RepID=UPI000987CFB1|nr:TonB-dependent receptor [Cognaticolwellia aestuarii]